MPGGSAGFRPAHPKGADQLLDNPRILDGGGHRILLAVCDLARDPMAGETDRVALTPTLVKRYPAPRMWVLGNLREPEIVGDLLRACGLDAKI